MRIKSISRLTILGAFLILVAAGGAVAQVDDCGTVLSAADIRAAIEQLPALDPLLRRGPSDTYSIPVVMHIVRSSTGTGGISPAEISDAIDSSNVLFAPYNLEVYEHQPINFIDDDYFFLDMSTSTKMDSLKRTDVFVQAVNIYWVPNSSGFPYCGLSSFTTSGVQGIIMNNSCGGTFSKNSTLVHEIGHYFNLYHTHEPAFGVECPSGSNCAIAGDLVCDTPADPNLLNHVSAAPACAYDNFAGTPGGCDATPYSPQTDNIMSYSRQSCRDLFTPGQVTRFRTTLETLRPELAIVVNDILVTPLSVTRFSVPLGDTRDSSIVIRNLGAATATISSAAFVLGNLSVVGGAPDMLSPLESGAVVFRFNAGALTSICDLGTVRDTLVINLTGVATFTARIPVTVELGLTLPGQPLSTFGANCLRFSVPNTPGIGDKSSSALLDPSGNTLYDGSLLIGLLDGSDTTVYMDAFNQKDFLEIDNYVSGVDAIGRQTRTIRWSTVDARLSGDVIYHFGANSGGIDSCSAIEVEYRIRNLCDTTLTIVPGMFGDFDINATNNDALVDAGNDWVYVSAGSHVAGFANLNRCQPDRGLRTISNPAQIYPTNGLQDGDAYAELVGGNDVNTLGTDVSVLLSFGRTQLSPGEEEIFRGAILVSTIGAPLLPPVAAALRALPPGRGCDLEVPFDFSTIQSALNYAIDRDTITLDDSIYTGSGNHSLDFLGKKVYLRGRSGAGSTTIDCNGSVGTPIRAFRFDSAAEDSTVTLDGLTIKRGYAPPDAPASRSDGGAILIMSGARPTIRNCVFEDNECERSGGAIAVVNSGSAAIIENCSFLQNTAQLDWGGAIWNGPGTTSRMSNCLFDENSADAGGAIAVDNSATPTVTQCRFVRNNAEFGGVMVVDDGQPVFEASIFDRNYATNAAGVVFSFQAGTTTTFTNCTFVRNYVTPSSSAIGSVFYSSDAHLIDLANCLVAFNDSGAVAVCAVGGIFDISCSDFFGNAGGDYPGCIAGFSGTANNISLDPIFCSLAGDDLRVRSNSPCTPANSGCGQLIGAGSPACGNTPAGSSVAVVLGAGVEVTFTTVTVDGETSLTTGATGPAGPAGFEIVPASPPVYYNLSTTAPYSGIIEVCISYDPGNIASGSEADLTLQHFTGSAWADITTALDTAVNIICGETNSFSPFVVAVRSYICGDADQSQAVSIADAVYLINYIFAGGPAPIPAAAGDPDCSGATSIADAVYLINYIFAGGAAPCAACP